MVNEHLREVLEQRMIPSPRACRFRDGVCVIEDGVRVEVAAPEFVEAAAKRFRQFWNVSSEISIREQPEAASLGDEAYRIEISPEKIAILSRTVAGCEYALSTVRQLAEPGRGTKTTRNHVVQAGEIEDAPALGFRGIHLCIFPETPMWFIEKQIRLAAYYKYNYAVIEAWGVFPFRSHPEFGWAGRMKGREEFIRLREVAKECGITVIPQFNLFGHATMARVGTAKHAVLDFHPELAPLFEPAGWSFCLTNPETRRILTDLVLELHEFYDSPRFFHIGCDEAYDFHTCRECAVREPGELLYEHIEFFRELLAGRGARSIMWHDMLLERGDPRWQGCTAYGSTRSVGLLETLSREIILADWQYETAPEANPEQEWPSTPYLLEHGFEVMICPWINRTGISQAGAMAGRRELFGFLETTWHRNYGHDFEPMYLHSSFAAWCGKAYAHRPLHQVTLAAHLRDVGRDMGIDAYEKSGHTMLQIAEVPFQP